VCSCVENYRYYVENIDVYFLILGSNLLLALGMFFKKTYDLFGCLPLRVSTVTRSDIGVMSGMHDIGTYRVKTSFEKNSKSTSKN